MTYQQLISTPCSTLSTMSYDAYRLLLLASYREVIFMDEQQKTEKKMEDWKARQKKIDAMELHVKSLHAHYFYKRFTYEYQTQIAA